MGYAVPCVARHFVRAGSAQQPWLTDDVGARGHEDEESSTRKTELSELPNGSFVTAWRTYGAEE